MISNRSIPPGTVIPVLVYPDVRAAVAWLTEVFGFVERVRIGEDHRSQMRIGADGAVIVADSKGDRQPPLTGVMTHLMKVRVTDVDAQFEHARARGARVLQEPTEYELASESAPWRTSPVIAGSSLRPCGTLRRRNGAARRSARSRPALLDGRRRTPPDSLLFPFHRRIACRRAPAQSTMVELA